MGPPRWTLTDFDSLSTAALYDLLRLRSEVFVLEQACVFQDIDGLDQQAMHLMGHRDGALVAYARCFPAHVCFAEASIGRVVTRAAARGGGLGHRLMTRAIQAIGDVWGVQAIRIGAQAHLTHFYQSHGFVDMGEPYVEDGIDHIEMLWTP
jgi:ElaA protein